MTIVEQLTQIFYDNFVAYYRSHAAHANVTGRNFRSDHKLLQGVYERRQEQIDRLGELLRTVGAQMPNDMYEILSNTHLPTDAIKGTADELLMLVLEDLEHLRDCYVQIENASDLSMYNEIENYSQDQVLDLSKSIWMLKSTLELG